MQKIKNIILACFLLFGVTALKAETIIGLWNTSQENTIIDIKKTGDKYVGVIHSSSNSKVTIGGVLLKDIIKLNDIYVGKIFVPKMNAYYDASIKPIGDTLKLTISNGFGNKSVFWMKLK